MPTNWTGRFLSTGNGGISGCIQCQYLSIEACLTEIFYEESKLTE
jgi:feruloyl esterase